MSSSLSSSTSLSVTTAWKRPRWPHQVSTTTSSSVTGKRRWLLLQWLDAFIRQVGRQVSEMDLGRTCVHMYIHTRGDVHTYVHTYTHTYIHTYIHTLHTSNHPSIHPCMHAYIHYIHTYIHYIHTAVGQQSQTRSFHRRSQALSRIDLYLPPRYVCMYVHRQVGRQVGHLSRSLQR